MSMAGYAQSYEESTAIFAAALALVNPENIDKADHAGWSPRQIIRILAEPGTQILGYDENAWSECSELGYRTLPIENSLALALAARNSSLEILQNLRTTDLAKFAIHSETGNFTLKNWLEVYTKHPVDHANQLREVIAEQKKS
jgi:hypothetical protein